MKGFIVQPTYNVRDNKPVVHLFGKLENGDSFLLKQDFQPYFFIKEEDVKKAESLLKNFKVEKTKMKVFSGKKAAKITVNIPAEVPGIKKQLEDKHIECYEADIRFAYRYMFDNEILGSCDIEGKYEKGDFVDRIYENASIKKAYYKPKLKILSIDIETDKKAEKLFSISLYTDDFKKVIIIKDTKELNNAITVKDEEQAIKKFHELLIKIDPDIITGWNLIDFDLKILKDKFIKYKVPFKIGRNNWESSLTIESGFMRDSKAKISGRVVLDGIQLLKMNFYRLKDYRLDTAASEYLGEKKIIGHEHKGEEIEDAYKNNPQKLVDYNLKDAKLVYDILEKVGLIELTIQRSLITGMPLDRVQASIASLDSLYLRELRKKYIVAPSAKHNIRKRITGGYVMTSKPGIYSYVIVCDFKSLYPSIIKTFNIDPLMFVPAQKKDDKDLIISPNGARFKREDGILPQLIQYLWEKRDNAKKIKDKQATFAIKILMNSFFGVLANPMCRFYSYDMANAITTFGQKLIKFTAQIIEKKGFEIIYGDTDSIFINLTVNSFAEAEKEGKEIESYINKFFAKFTMENYNRKNFLEMEFEKVYKKFLMPYVRSGTTGAKKRYAGIIQTKEADKIKENMEFVGMEFVRRDWTELSKKFQVEFLKRIFEEKPVESFVSNFIKNLKDGKFDDLLIYRKALRKKTAEYVKITPPHVKAARILERDNMLDSNIIQYIMTSNGPEPIQLKKHSIDYEHYIDKQIRPIADSILIFFKKSISDIIAGGKQANLFDF